MDKLVSVIIVVYNSVHTINRAIESVIEFKNKKIELIIIDGESNDGTLDIIKKYNENIDYWISENDDGIYDAMNKGIRASTGKYIYFLGADDILLEIPFRALEKAYMDKIGILYGNVMLNSGKKMISSLNWKLKIINTVHHQSMFLLREWSLKFPFDTKYFVYADFDVNQKIYKENILSRYIDCDIALFNENGVSSNIPIFERLNIIYNNYGMVYTVMSAVLHTMVLIKKVICKWICIRL